MLSQQAGEPPRLAEYLARFPQLAEQLPPLFEVHQAIESMTPVVPHEASGTDDGRGKPGDGAPAKRTATIDYQGDPAGYHDDLATISRAARPEEAAAALAAAKSPARIGRYVIRQRLGAGTFGEVFRGFDEQIRREVAVKVSRIDGKHSQGSVESFLREARSVAQLKHPGIVTVYDVGEEGGRCFVVYELIEGMSLHGRMRDGSPMPHREVALLMADVADALHHAHVHGFVHRDIKPANILIDELGHPRVVDFGLAVREDELGSERGRIAGTFSYMSPEQICAEGHRLDGRTDIYSLGVVLYELLCGRRPHAGTTLNELRDQICHPAAGIKWAVAVTYCRWLTRMANLPESLEVLAATDEGGSRRKKYLIQLDRPGYRLPTEAEWENACRAGTVTTFSFGSDRERFADYGWAPGEEQLVDETLPSGRLMPNTRGLFDMYGNVQEWCFNRYDSYAGESEVDPVGPDTETGNRVTRGGNFMDALRRWSRSAARSEVPETTDSYQFGFRIVRTLPTAENE